jgi:hypothetical protein
MKSVPFQSLLHRWSVTKVGKDATVATNFEDLSRALATGVSRRQAVKLMGGAVAGSVLAVMHLSRAEAAPSTCAVVCGKTGFVSGPAHAQCLQACRQCAGNIQNLCFGPTGAVCCQNGTVCSLFTGTCVQPCTCESGTPCGTGSCLCVQTVEGQPACIVPSCGSPCTASTDCGSGFVCFQSGPVCCGTGGFCVALCA